MAVRAPKYITEGEYLALEAGSDVKHEYLDGQVFAMAGASPEHVLITSNMTVEFAALARPRGCDVYPSDLRIRAEATGLNTYPDLSVVCGELQRTEQRPAGAINPKLIVEVLSESTRDYDRSEKWRHYQTIESLTDYVLVWQDRPWVEHYARLSGGRWEYRLVEGLDARLPIESLGGGLALSEIYRGVRFPELPTLRHEPEPADGSSENQ